MKKKTIRNIIKQVTVAAFGIMMTTQIVFAASTWSSAGVYQLKRGDSYVTVTTAGDMLNIYQ